MSKVRVYEVAKQLNMDQKTLVALFQSMGVGDVKNHMSAVEVDVVDRVKRHLERQKQPEGMVEERVRADGRVVKRRARAQDADAPASHGDVSQVAPASSAVPSAPGSQSGFDRATYEEREARRMPSPAPSQPRADAAPASRAVPEHAPAARVAAEPAPSVREIPPAPPSRTAAAQQPEPEPAREESAKARPDHVLAEPPAPRLEARQELPVTDIALPLSAAAEPAIPTARSSEPRTAIAPPPVTRIDAPLAPLPPPPPPPAVRPAEPDRAPAARGAPGRPTPAPIGAGERRSVDAAPQPSADRGQDTVVRRPSAPPKTGIDVWQGRPGVPMPAVQRTSPPARRTTYNPRANTPGRPGGGPGGYGPGRPQGTRPNQRMGFRPRPGMTQTRKASAPSTQEMSAHKKVIKIEEQVNLQQLAGKMGLKATDVLMKLLSMGMTGVHINSTLDADTAKILASEFGWSVEDVAVSEEQSLAAAMGADESEAEAEERPPIVTVMGHVDHGKTSLLDRIRKASVAEGEAGGITQHIGAYRVETPRGTIAFLDTPGHEAFTAMRARGASVTDIVILVVAADDGVMPQTREAIAHAQSAKVPIIVAVNKIDKPGAEPERIRRDLAGLGLQSEEWGGDTMFALVSARTGEGIEQLLEAVLLQAEVLELRAHPSRRASGTVIEALLDRGRGPVARVMVQDGTVRTGDVLLAGGAWGKVRAMTDEFGRALAEAGPSTPIEVLGLNEVPSAGDPVHAVKDAKTAEEIAETRRKKASKSLIPQNAAMSLDTLVTRLAEADQLELKLIIKGDVQGSVEAVGAALAKLSTQKVKVTVVHAAVGAITEGDVNLAIASKAIIVGFNVRPAGKSTSLAEAEGIEIRLYNIIYNAVDDIRSAMEGLLPATKVEKILGRAETRRIFRMAKVGVVAGCMVTSGTIKRTAEVRLLRDNVVVWTGKLSGLRRFKDEAKDVAEGFECGISLDGYADVKDNDIIESFEIEEIKSKL